MAHAILSPSSASRWIACSPSARLEQNFTDSESAAAWEGSLAHALGELLIKQHFGMVTPQKYKKEFKVIQAGHIPGREDPANFSNFYGKEMQGYCEDYRDYVIEHFNEAKARDPFTEIHLETKLDMTDWVPEGFGTGDVVIVADHTAVLIDLKYGKGVPVDAFENKQLLLYGLGVLNAYDFLYDIRMLDLHIYQPRLRNFSSYRMQVPELRHWAKNVLAPAAELAFAGKGEFKVGDHCRFCRAKPLCRALAEHNLKLAKLEYKNHDLLTDLEVVNVLDQIELLVSYANAVKKYALDQAITENKNWPGYKLVEGRSNRKYADETAVAEKVIAEGWPETEVYTKEIIGITAMEKLLGKKAMVEVLEGLIVKPPGAPVLVPENDKRPVFKSVESDFNFLI